MSRRPLHHRRWAPVSFPNPPLSNVLANPCLGAGRHLHQPSPSWFGTTADTARGQGGKQNYPRDGFEKYGDTTFADPVNKKYPIDTQAPLMRPGPTSTGRPTR